MRGLAIAVVVVIGGLLAWFVGSKLSADAVGMGVGLVFGILAGVPTALLVMAAGRRGSRRSEDEEEGDERTQGAYGAGYGAQRGYGAPGFQPPVIVLAAPQQAPPQWQQGPYQQGPYAQGPYAQGPYAQGQYAQPGPGWQQPPTVDGVSYPVRQALPGPGAPGAPGGRVFKVVGEKEEVLDEW